jgi:DNA-binding NtrC family response regulator
MENKMFKLRVLVADDQVHYRQVLISRLQQCSSGIFQPIFTEASTPEEAVLESEKSQIAGQPFDLVLLDINFDKQSQRDGHWAASEIREVLAEAMVVLISAMSEKEHMDAVEQSDIITRFFRKGSFTDLELFRVGVWASLKRLHKEHRLIASEKALHTQADSMKEFISELDQVSPETNVMICGETGTGKELSALRLNANAKFELNQKERSFVALDCSALASDVVESELFGHAKGAFTGAVSDKIGHLEKANGGDLFLDEIQNLPLSIQKKLLRALQEKKFSPVGSTKVVSLDVRIISAINKDLDDCLEGGVLMPDFVARLRHSSLKIPPLRAREGDTDLLAELVLKRFNGDKGFSPDALQTLRMQAWPENVRGFLSVCTSILASARTPIVTSGTILKYIPARRESQERDEDTSSLESVIQDSVALILRKSHDFAAVQSAFEKAFLQSLIYSKGCKSVYELSRTVGLPNMTTKRKVKEYSLVFCSKSKLEF